MISTKVSVAGNGQQHALRTRDDSGIGRVSSGNGHGEAAIGRELIAKLRQFPEMRIHFAEFRAMEVRLPSQLELSEAWKVVFSLYAFPLGFATICLAFALITLNWALLLVELARLLISAALALSLHRGIPNVRQFSAGISALAVIASVLAVAAASVFSNLWLGTFSAAGILIYIGVTTTLLSSDELETFVGYQRATRRREKELWEQMCLRNVMAYQLEQYQNDRISAKALVVHLGMLSSRPVPELSPVPRSDLGQVEELEIPRNC